jgi:hypothetical protein
MSIPPGTRFGSYEVAEPIGSPMGGSTSRKLSASQSGSPQRSNHMITLPEDGAASAAAAAPRVQINVVLNWFEELTRRVPQR